MPLNTAHMQRSSPGTGQLKDGWGPLHTARLSPVSPGHRSTFSPCHCSACTLFTASCRHVYNSLLSDQATTKQLSNGPDHTAIQTGLTATLAHIPHAVQLASLSSPLSAMTTFLLGLPLPLPSASTL
eukprot:GHRR01014128.1.p1 GENE.GHRR01014128.1~~GHRR01014128.1.p1  ORF type:complete len:127 (+),score=14.17 GHRR01014128.1:1679-2059(+)